MNMKLITVHPNLAQKARNPDLKSALQPYLLFLKFLGIVHCPRGNGISPWKDPWTIYCLVVVLYSWVVLLIRWETKTFTGETSTLVTFLIGLTTVLTEAISITSLFITGVHQNGLGTIFELWAQLQLKPDRLNVLEGRMRMASWCILGLSLIFMAIRIPGMFHCF